LVHRNRPSGKDAKEAMPADSEITISNLITVVSIVASVDITFIFGVPKVG
jgi:hypothetical protein